jgi:HSP20 family protein
MGNKNNNNLVDSRDLTNDDWMQEYEGQLAIDAYQTDDSVVVKAPIAGVKPDELEISITDDAVTIKGERKEERELTKDNYLCQECYWGSFSRMFSLPIAVDSEHAKAALKNGILTITIPKLEKSKKKIIKVKTE